MCNDLEVMCREHDENDISVADAGSDARCLHPVISGSSVPQLLKLSRWNERDSELWSSVHNSKVLRRRYTIFIHIVQESNSMWP